MKIKATFKYLLMDFCKSVFFYFIILLIFYSIIFITVFQFPSSQYNNINRQSVSTVYLSGFGLDTITAVFILIIGYHALRSTLRPLIQNSISRKTIYISQCLASFTFAFLLTTLNWLLLILFKITTLLISKPNYTVEWKSLYEMIYKLEGIRIGSIFFYIMNFIYTFNLFLFVMIAGYFISLIYYRINRIGKILLNTTLISFFTVLKPAVNRLSNDKVNETIRTFFDHIFGVSANRPGIAILTFTLLIAATAYISWLLIKRVTVRE